MYKRRPSLKTTLLLAMLFLNVIARAQEPPEALLSAVNKNAIPFSLLNTQSNKRFDALFTGARVIALGEATHGTHEFYAAKTELIKYLVQHHNLKLVALETDFCGIEHINEFVHNKLPKEADTAVRFTDLYGVYGIYRTAETRDLVKWLKAYNSNKPTSAQVSITGLDMQDPYFIAISILEDAKSIRLDATDLELLTKIKDAYWAKKELKITKAEQASYDKLVANLNRVAATRANDAKTALFKRHIRLLEQTFALRNVSMASYKSRRDEYLAENALWLLNNTDTNAKMAVWAHNGHISYSGDQKLKRFGYHLKEKLGYAYFALALTFDEGSVRIYDFKGTPRGYKSYPYPPVTKKNAIEYLLSRTQEPNFIIDLRRISEDKANMDEFNNYKYMRVIGAEYLEGEQNIFFKTPIVSAFDGILFFRKTQAAVALNAKSSISE